MKIQMDAMDMLIVSLTCTSKSIHSSMNFEYDYPLVLFEFLLISTYRRTYPLLHRFGSLSQDWWEAHGDDRDRHSQADVAHAEHLFQVDHFVENIVRILCGVVGDCTLRAEIAVDEFGIVCEMTAEIQLNMMKWTWIYSNHACIYIGFRITSLNIPVFKLPSSFPQLPPYSTGQAAPYNPALNIFAKVSLGKPVVSHSSK